MFPEAKFDPIDEDGEEEGNVAGKIFKVSYKINMMPMVDMYVSRDKNGKRCMVNEGQSLLRDCIAGDEIEVFSVPNMQDLI